MITTGTAAYRDHRITETLMLTLNVPLAITQPGTDRTVETITEGKQPSITSIFPQMW